MACIVGANDGLSEDPPIRNMVDTALGVSDMIWIDRWFAE